MTNGCISDSEALAKEKVDIFDKSKWAGFGLERKISHSQHQAPAACKDETVDWLGLAFPIYTYVYAYNREQKSLLV